MEQRKLNCDGKGQANTQAVVACYQRMQAAWIAKQRPKLLDIKMVRLPGNFQDLKKHKHYWDQGMHTLPATLLDSLGASASGTAS